MIYVFLADGFEEVEAIAPIDLMRRARLEVMTVGVSGKTVLGSHGISVTADVTEDEIRMEDAQCVVLPGGLRGTDNLEASAAVREALDFCFKNERLIAAICAAPRILGKRGMLSGKRATVYPGFESELKGATLAEEYVVKDGNIITARGMGVSVDFGLKLVEVLVSEKAAEVMGKKIQCREE